MENELFTRKEIAAIFRIRPRTLWHWEKRGLIKPDHYVNGHPRYSIEAIEQLSTEKQTIFHNDKTAPNGK